MHWHGNISQVNKAQKQATQNDCTSIFKTEWSMYVRQGLPKRLSDERLVGKAQCQANTTFYNWLRQLMLCVTLPCTAPVHWTPVEWVCGHGERNNWISHIPPELQGKGHSTAPVFVLFYMLANTTGSTWNRPLQASNSNRILYWFEFELKLSSVANGTGVERRGTPLGLNLNLLKPDSEPVKKMKK